MLHYHGKLLRLVTRSRKRILVIHSIAFPLQALASTHAISQAVILRLIIKQTLRLRELRGISHNGGSVNVKSHAQTHNTHTAACAPEYTYTPEIYF